MKRKLLLVLSLLIFTIFIVSITLPVFSQGPTWTRINTDGRKILLINESTEKIIVRWDNKLVNGENDSDIYLQSIVLPNEIFIMPETHYIYLSVPMERVYQKDYSTIIITD